MAFDYQTLKQINSNAITNGTLVAGNFASQTIDTTDIADGSIDSTKFATGAVNYTTAVVTGVMPIAKGGTALSSVGGANTLLRTNSAGNGFEYATTGFASMQVFTGTSTWNRPAGIRFIKIKCQAGGGGASGHGESGAAGGYSERVLDVTGISSVAVTIGGGGGGTYYSGAGSDGGTTSFGPYCSAGGGHGANRQNQHSGGVSGAGSGGNLNIHTGSGGAHHHSFGPGGTSHFGGPAPSGHPQGGHFAHNHQGHAAPGTGGTGGYFQGHRGSDGKAGIIVIEEFK
jgi:hypothetical protein